MYMLHPYTSLKFNRSENKRKQYARAVVFHFKVLRCIYRLQTPNNILQN